MPKHSTLTTDNTFTGANIFDQNITTNGGIIVNDGAYGIYLYNEDTTSSNIYNDGNKLMFVAPDFASYEFGGTSGNAVWDFSILSTNRTYIFPDADGTIALESGVSGSFTSADGKTITVVNGIITAIETS